MANEKMEFPGFVASPEKPRFAADRRTVSPLAFQDASSVRVGMASLHRANSSTPTRLTPVSSKCDMQEGALVDGSFASPQRQSVCSPAQNQSTFSSPAQNQSVSSVTTGASSCDSAFFRRLHDDHYDPLETSMVPCVPQDPGNTPEHVLAVQTPDSTPEHVLAVQTPDSTPEHVLAVQTPSSTPEHVLAVREAELSYARQPAVYITEVRRTIECENERCGDYLTDEVNADAARSVTDDETLCCAADFETFLFLESRFRTEAAFEDHVANLLDPASRLPSIPEIPDHIPRNQRRALAMRQRL